MTENQHCECASRRAHALCQKAREAMRLAWWAGVAAFIAATLNLVSIVMRHSGTFQ